MGSRASEGDERGEARIECVEVTTPEENPCELEVEGRPGFANEVEACALRLGTDPVEASAETGRPEETAQGDGHLVLVHHVDLMDLQFQHAHFVA